MVLSPCHNRRNGGSFDTVIDVYVISMGEFQHRGCFYGTGLGLGLGLAIIILLTRYSTFELVERVLRLFSKRKHFINEVIYHLVYVHKCILTWNPACTIFCEFFIAYSVENDGLNRRLRTLVLGYVGRVIFCV